MNRLHQRDLLCIMAAILYHGEREVLLRRIEKLPSHYQGRPTVRSFHEYDQQQYIMGEVVNLACELAERAAGWVADDWLPEAARAEDAKRGR